MDCARVGERSAQPRRMSEGANRVPLSDSFAPRVAVPNSCGMFHQTSTPRPRRKRCKRRGKQCSGHIRAGCARCFWHFALGELWTLRQDFADEISQFYTTGGFGLFQSGPVVFFAPRDCDQRRRRDVPPIARRGRQTQTRAVPPLRVARCASRSGPSQGVGFRTCGAAARVSLRSRIRLSHHRHAQEPRASCGTLAFLPAHGLVNSDIQPPPRRVERPGG